VPISAADRALLQRLLHREPGAWKAFVDRYLGLIYHVIRYTAHLRGVEPRPEDVEDLAAEILLQLVANDFAVLRHFRAQSSLATYLTVVSRRICVHELNRQRRPVPTRGAGRRAPEPEDEGTPKAKAGLETLEEVQRLMRKLSSRERQVVRLYYIEGRSYEEIGMELNIPINSIGPILSRARKRLKEDSVLRPPPKT
jgi:RNA polymerase sigma-70 factor (ECF subfamily)